MDDGRLTKEAVGGRPAGNGGGVNRAARHILHRSTYERRAASTLRARNCKRLLSVCNASRGQKIPSPSKKSKVSFNQGARLTTVHQTTLISDSLLATILRAHSPHEMLRERRAPTGMLPCPSNSEQRSHLLAGAQVGAEAGSCVVAERRARCYAAAGSAASARGPSPGGRRTAAGLPLHRAEEAGAGSGADPNRRPKAVV